MPRSLTRVSAIGGARARSGVRKVAGVSRAMSVRAGRWTRGAGVRARTEALQRRGYVPGLLSVVVPAYNVEEYLDECLLSLRFQTYTNLEIIVVDDGSPDASARIARSHIRRDPRVRLVRRPNGGLSAARNTGIEAAHGEFLTFVDSDDTVDHNAYAGIIAALQESGSDFAVSMYDRLDKGKRRPAVTWIREAHAQRRLACTLEEFPDIQVNAVAWSKVYRRTFWDEAGLSFPVGVHYEDQPVSSAAYAKARTFDVLPEISVSWRIRYDRSSISQQSWSPENLKAQIAATDTSLDILTAAGRKQAADARALQLINNNMPFFAQHLLHGDPEFWGLLRDALQQLIDRVPRSAYISEVNAHHKVLNDLILKNRYKDAEFFLEENGTDAKRFPTRRIAEGVRIDLPVSDDVPDDCFLLAERQLVHTVRVIRARWETAPDRLALEGWAYIRNLDLAENPPTVSIALVGPDGQRVPFEVETRPEPRTDGAAPHHYCDYRPGGFRAVLDVDRLPRTAGEWQVEVRIEAGGITRVGPVKDVAPVGSAAIRQSRMTAPGLVHTVARADEGLALVVTTGAYATDHELDAAGDLHLRVTGDDVAAVHLSPANDPGKVVTAAKATPDGPGSWTAHLATSGLARATMEGLADPEGTRLQLWVTDRRGESVPLLASPATPPALGLASDTAPLRAPFVGRSTGGELRLFRRPVRAEVRSFDVAPDAITVDVVTGGVSADGFEPVLTSPSHELVGTTEVLDDGVCRVRFPFHQDRWGRTGLTVPQGRYVLSLRLHEAGVDLKPTPVTEVVDALPTDDLLPQVRVLVELVPGEPGLAVSVKPPVPEDERGARNQRRLREECRVEVADRDSVFFRALYGEVANCNMLGVHDELVRRGSALTLYWSVQDYSVPVPPGGVPVIEGTREWHEAIARSRYQMVNVHQLHWFTKPEGQVMIETMHGYPYKVMGHEWWDKRGFPASQVRNFDRRAREWDYFVSPATYATPLLEKAFLAPADAHPEILEIGYPRNDILLSPEGQEVRNRLRQVLGIRPDQKVVMYAPTFRDYLSADDMQAARVDFLDFAAATRALGDDYVFLVRGHAFNARAGGRIDGDRTVIDVTTYPDVNDLILASDAAVLDYSSLRFDYAVTRKPMIFLVPDLEKYNKARGGVIDYAPTAPGPFVSTTKEVVQLLRDLPGLAAKYAAEQDRFRADYVDLEDGHASARLVDAVFVPRGDAPARD